jgi:hypothetical protein
MRIARAVIIFIITLPITVVVGSIGWKFLNTSSYSFRLTAVAEADGNSYTGSGVIQVLWEDTGAGSLQERGEAIIVDIGARGTLFITLKDVINDSWAAQITFRTFPFTRKLGEYIVPELSSRAVRRYARERMTANLDLNSLPMRMVRFRNILEPTTVENVDPRNLAASFGQGVTLKNITLETVNSGWWPLNIFGVTGEPVTVGIGDRLSWLSRHPEPLLDPRFANTLSTSAKTSPLTHGAFRRRTQ